MRTLKKTKVLIKMLCITIIVSLFSNIHILKACDGEENQELINYVQITDNASKKFQSIKDTHKEWINSYLVLKRVIFDSNNEVNGFIFDVMSDNNNVGYVIADYEDGNNIIEFGKELFLDEASETVEREYSINEDNQKVYYLGNLNYAIGGLNGNNKNVFVDVTTNKCEKITKKEVKAIENQSTLGSPPDSGNNFITDPSLYERGYSSYKAKDLTNFNIAYKVMTDFSDGSVCAPTAATNFMYYWYNKDKTKYEKMYYKKSWKETFKKIYKYMETNDTNGTLDANLVNGYSKFLKAVGIACTVKFHNGTSNGKKIVTEINNNRPCHLALHNHYRYGDHSVLAVGYQKYTYEHWYGDNVEIYIRISDGWQRYPWRWVWGNCTGSWNYVSVSLN